MIANNRMSVSGETMRQLLIIGLLISLLLLAGCWVYGKGETTGYIYAIDDGIFWDKVWYKSNLQSSESDCYLIKNDALKEQLRSISANTTVKLSYNRHLFTIASCPEGTGTDDEITQYQVIK